MKVVDGGLDGIFKMIPKTEELVYLEDFVSE